MVNIQMKFCKTGGEGNRKCV